MISYINLFLEWGKTLPISKQNELIALFKAVNNEISQEEFENRLLAFRSAELNPLANYPSFSGNHKHIVPNLIGHSLAALNKLPTHFNPNSQLFLKEFLRYFLIPENFIKGKDILSDVLKVGLIAHEATDSFQQDSAHYSRLMEQLFSFILLKKEEFPGESTHLLFYKEAVTTTLGLSFFRYLDEASVHLTLERVYFVYQHIPLEAKDRMFVFDVFLRIAFESAGNQQNDQLSVSPLLSWYKKGKNKGIQDVIAGRFLTLSLEKGIVNIAYLTEKFPVISAAMHAIWQFNEKNILSNTLESKELFLENAGKILDVIIKFPYLVTSDSQNTSPIYQLLQGFDIIKESLPDTIKSNHVLQRFLLDKYLQCAAENPTLWESTVEKIGNKSILDRGVLLVISAAFHRQNEMSEGKNIALFRSLISFTLEEILQTYPSELGLTFIKIIVSPDTGFGFRYGFDRQWADQMVEAALALFSQHPHLIAAENTWDDLFSGVSDALKESKIQQLNLLPELTRMILEKSALQLNLRVSLENGKEEYLLIAGLREILAALSANETSNSKHPQLTPGQLLSFVELLLDAVIKNPNWLTTSFEGNPMIREVLAIPFRTLSKIPADQRLGYDLLTQVIESELEAIERSPHLMDRIQYGESPSEKTVLEHAFNLVIAWLFPPGERAGLHKTKQLMDVIAYAIEDLVSENPNTTGLAILELILSDAVGLDLSNGIIEDQTDELVEAVLLAIATQPELIQEAPGLREIAQESAGAIHLLSIDHPEIGLEILRNLFEESAGRLTILLEVNDTQFRHLLIEALQQFATAISMERKNGRYTIKLSEDQILDLVQIIFEGVVEQPEWVEDEYIHQVLDAILQAVDAKSGGRRIPYLLVSLLFQALLPMAQERSELLEKIEFGEKREAIAISYVVERLLNLLLGLDLKDWRKVTQDEAIEAIVHFYLNLINQWDMSAASIEAAMTHLKQLVRQFATGTLSQDEFLDLLSEEDDDEE